MSYKTTSVLKRIGRSILVVAIAEATRQLTGSPYAAILIPLLQGLGKYLREKKGMERIPF